MLILPGSPAFANCTDNLTGTPPAASIGTNFNAGINNTDSTSVAVLSALSHNVSYLCLGIGGLSGNGVNSQCLMDVLIDTGGGSTWSATPLISDLMCGFTPAPAAGATGLETWYYFPLYVPSGASLGVRCRSVAAATISTGRIAMFAYGNPKRPEMWWQGTSVESVGLFPATSSGTTVTPGNSGAFGSWANLLPAPTGRVGAIQLGFGGSDSTAAALGYYFQIGYDSIQLAGSNNMYVNLTTNEICAKAGWNNPMWCDIPAGVTIQSRGVCSGTAEAIQIAAYCVI